MTKRLFEVRVATKDEATLYLHDMCLSERWPKALIDSRIFAEANTYGIFVAIDTSPANSGVLGIISANGHGTPAGFIGHFIVRPDMRGCGVGGALFAAAMNHLKECETVGLDAGVEAAPLYANKGFKYTYNTVRYRSTNVPVTEADEHKLSREYENAVETLGADIEFVDPAGHIDEIAAYEASISGMSRPAFIRALIDLSSSNPQVEESDRTVATVVVLREVSTKKIVAFAAIRPGALDVARVAPLYADTPDLAARVMRVLLAKYYQRHGTSAQTVYLDSVGEDSHSQRVTSFVDSVSRDSRWTNITVSGRYPRMWTNGYPAGQCLDKVYALLSNEAG
ncbi:hypothetical protein GQ42DRAFT_57981 [Ramicandelaber brevisporus]|nr:hypothetical protein GQ42DRAFT_57981 [Ramicandelaber brevisporus]